MRHLDLSEEQKLIVRAKEGDMDAFEQIVKAHQQGIYFLCRRFLGSHAPADDAAQETFIKAYLALDSFKEDLSFFSWIRRIAVNTCLNAIKSAKREEPLGKRDAAEKALPQDELQNREMNNRFQQALEALPSEQKAVFVLRVHEGQSYRDIARTLRISEGTVMSRLSRARRKLRTALAGYADRRRP